MSSSISVVIVTFNSAAELARSLPALASELGSEDEVIVVDNGSTDDTREVVGRELPSARVEALPFNAGFAAAVNHGASVAGEELLVVLNPDAAPEPGWGEAIRRPAVERPEWTAWMALVTYEEGGSALVNSAGNPVHFTGLVWAGGHGSPVEESQTAREVPTASGACLAIRRGEWEELGGFPEEFFLYHEDVDLSVRIRLRGGRVGIEPAAVVSHDYEFEGNPSKWRWLERNRWAMLIRCYPAPLLALLAPGLALTELALIPVAAKGGWLRQKAASWLDLLAWIPRLIRERREIRAANALTALEFSDVLTARLDSVFLPPAVRSGPIATALDLYWKVVRALLRFPG